MTITVAQVLFKPNTTTNLDVCVVIGESRDAVARATRWECYSSALSARIVGRSARNRDRGHRRVQTNVGAHLWTGSEA